MQEISNNEDYEWISAIMAIDDWKSFEFLNNYNKQAVKQEMDKMEQEMFHLFDIYGNGTTKNEFKYFGYRLNSNNGEFGLILYDSKDISKCFVAAHEILETLKEEISMKCKFTVSIGSSRLIEDDLGIMDDWIERIKSNLKRAQKGGKNEICFGTTNGNDDDDEKENDNVADMELKIEDDIEADKIEKESLQVIKKYGFAAAVDLSKVKLIVNRGNLVNENDIDVKWDCDPTESFSLKFATNTTWKQILLEVTEFIDKNNKKAKQYLEYPKFYLNSNKPKCQDKSKCEQCCDSTTSNYNGLFSLCSTKRREIANNLFDNAQEQQCKTKSVFAVTRQLFLSDKVLIQDSNKYKLYPNWFERVCSFLVWQQDVVKILLYNLVQMDDIGESNGNTYYNHAVGGYSDTEEEEKKQIELVTSGADCVTVDVTNEVEKSLFFIKFNLLTSLHLYLNELIEYLVLYYCCFDSQLWIAVFYPFIEAGIGTLHCKMLFADFDKDECSTITKSICDEALAIDANVSLRQQLSNTKKYLKETKAIAIFKHILCNVYTTRDNEIHLIDAKITYNPFDLAHKIHVKLQETINNIKTQLLISEITGINANKSHSITIKQKVNAWKDQHDDWAADKNAIIYQNSMKIEAPSFIRLFVIRRIISKYLRNDTDKQKVVKIKKLANVFKKDSATALVVRDIVTRLIRDGLKQYMNKWYNEKEQLYIIEMIFKKIILQKFSKEYNKLVKYVGNRRNRKKNGNCKLLFNSTDLMCNVFQYLTYGRYFDGDLSVCNLVNSHWLYHAWNLNSVYFIDLTDLIFITYSYHIYNGIDMKRMWQRVINARSVYIDDDDLEGVKANDIILNRISMLRKVESIDVHLDHSLIAILRMIMIRCREGIINCNVNVHYDKNKMQENKSKKKPLSPLILPNARYVGVNDLYFYRVWSDKCQKLVFNLANMNQEWCQFVIEHCSCKNVRQLELCLIRDNDEEIDEMVLKSFAAKFRCLERLKLVFYGQFDPAVLLFWQLLKSMIEKNNGNVEVILDDKYKLKQQDADFLVDTIEKQDLKIDNVTKLRTDGAMTGETIDGWVIGHIIDQGGFGQVYEARNTANGMSGAAKFMTIYPERRLYENNKDAKKRNKMAVNEINAFNLIAKSNNKSIIQLISHKKNICVASKDLEQTMLIFEYMTNGNLYDYMKSNKRFDLAICKRFFDQIVDAVDYLHNELYIAHRDLSPKNLLLDNDFNIKIIDFGCCKIINDDQVRNDNYNDTYSESKTADTKTQHLLSHSTRVGTPGYIAPEIACKRQYLTSQEEKLLCDVFSLGIILWKMLVGIDSKPFDDFDFFDGESNSIKYVHKRTYKLIEDKKYDFWWKKFKNDIPYYHDHDLKNLFVKMFDPLPKTRIRVVDIKNNQWYKKINKKYKHNYNQEYFISQMKQMWIHKEFAAHHITTVATETTSTSMENNRPTFEIGAYSSGCRGR